MFIINIFMPYWKIIEIIHQQLDLTHIFPLISSMNRKIYRL